MKNKPPQIDFKPGATYHATVPFWGGEPFGGKIYIVQIIDERLQRGYVGPQVVFRCYGKHKRYWHYFILSKGMLEFYIQQAKDFRSDKEYVERVKKNQALNKKVGLNKNFL